MDVHCRTRIVIASLMCCALLDGTRALGQDCPCGAPYAQIVDDGEFLRPDFSAGFDQENLTDFGPTNLVSACSGPFCGSDCRSPGLIFRTELVWLGVTERGRADLANALVHLQNPARDDIGAVNAGLKASPRVSIGGQTCNGLGVRGTYWEYDNAVSENLVQPTPDDPNQVVHGWDVHVFDLEVMRNQSNWGWDFTLSGGYRLADYEEGATTELNGTESAALNTRFFGNGITGAIEMRRSLWSRFGIMLNGRYSLLFGAERISATNVNIPPITIDQSFDARYIIEGQAGIMYQHPICGGGYWFGRGGVEAQYWNDYVAPIGQPDPAPVIFSGFFVAIGLQR